MEKIAGGSPQVPAQTMPVKMKEFITALKNARLAGRFEAGSIILSMDAASREKFEQGLDALDLGKASGKMRTFRLPFKEPCYGISVTYADDQHWHEELVRSAAQMQQSGCVRWPVVRLANNSPYTIDKIEVIIPGKFSDAELAPGKLDLEEKAAQAIATQKPGRNDPCPCGSGKKFKRCHGF